MGNQQKIEIGKTYDIDGRSYILTSEGLQRPKSNYVTYSYDDSIKKISGYTEPKSKTTKKRRDTLEEDLEFYANEVYEKGDVQAGIKLIIEIVGVVTLGATLVSALFIWLPGAGIAISAGMAAHLMREASKAYSSMSREERRYLRAATKIFTVV